MYANGREVPDWMPWRAARHDELAFCEAPDCQHVVQKLFGRELVRAHYVRLVMPPDLEDLKRYQRLADQINMTLGQPNPDYGCGFFTRIPAAEGLDLRQWARVAAWFANLRDEHQDEFVRDTRGDSCLWPYYAVRGGAAYRGSVLDTDPALASWEALRTARIDPYDPSAETSLAREIRRRERLSALPAPPGTWGQTPSGEFMERSGTDWGVPIIVLGGIGVWGLAWWLIRRSHGKAAQARRS